MCGWPGRGASGTKRQDLCLLIQKYLFRSRHMILLQWERSRFRQSLHYLIRHLYLPMVLQRLQLSMIILPKSNYSTNTLFSTVCSKISIYNFLKFPFFTQI